MNDFSFEKNLLVICGHSGTGKTTLVDNLVKEYPDTFNKWEQVTTRQMREGETYGNPYVFIDDIYFNRVKDNLVGVIGRDTTVSEETSYKARYGSIPKFEKDKISVVILSEEGLLDLKTRRSKGFIEIDNLMIVGVNDISIQDEETFEKTNAKRTGRDFKFIENERNVLRQCDTVLSIDTVKGRYVDVRELELYITHLLLPTLRRKYHKKSFEDFVSEYFDRKSSLIYTVDSLFNAFEKLPNPLTLPKLGATYEHPRL